MAKITIDTLTEKHLAMIAAAKSAPDWTLTTSDFPASDFKPLVRLDIFRDYRVYEIPWTLTEATSDERFRELMDSPHTVEFKLTEFGNKVHHDRLYKWYTENDRATNVTSLWDDTPIQFASYREPYKSPKQLEAETKLARWNKLAKG